MAADSSLTRISARRACSRRSRERASVAPAASRNSSATPSAARLAASRTSAASPASTMVCDLLTASSAMRSRPGSRSPRTCRSASTRSSSRTARAVPRSAALIDAASRSRRVASARSRSLSSPRPMSAEERKKAAVGNPLSSASSASTWPGSVVVTPSTVRLTVAPAPNDFSTLPWRSVPSRSAGSALKSRRTDGRALGAAAQERRPSANVGFVCGVPVSASSRARTIVVLPDSFGPRTMVRPGASSTWRSRWRLTSLSRSVEILIVPVPDRPAAGDPAGGPPAVRRRVRVRQPPQARSGEPPGPG